MSRFLTAVLAAFLLVAAWPALALPISAGQHGFAVAFPLHDHEGGVPGTLVTSMTEIANTSATHTSGSGQAGVEMSVSSDGMLVRGYAEVPGAAGRAVAEASALGLLTFTNTGSEALSLWASIMETWDPFYEDGFPWHGPATFVNEPLRENAYWLSSFLIADPACNELADPENCAAASAAFEIWVNADEPGWAVTVGDEVFFGRGYHRDFTYLPLFHRELAPGESASFMVEATFRAEAVRVSEPGAVALLLVGGGLLIAAKRQRRRCHGEA